jgi:hypothetical protein
MRRRLCARCCVACLSAAQLTSARSIPVSFFACARIYDIYPPILKSTFVLWIHVYACAHECKWLYSCVPRVSKSARALYPCTNSSLSIKLLIYESILVACLFVTEMFAASNRFMACIYHELNRVHIYFSTDRKKFGKILCILISTTLIVLTFLFGKLSTFIIRYSVDTTPDFPPNPSCSCVYENQNFNLCFDNNSTPFSCRLLSGLSNGNAIFMLKIFFVWFYLSIEIFSFLTRVIWTISNIYPQEKLWTKNTSHRKHRLLLQQRYGSLWLTKSYLFKSKKYIYIK